MSYPRRLAPHELHTRRHYAEQTTSATAEVAYSAPAVISPSLRPSVRGWRPRGSVSPSGVRPCARGSGSGHDPAQGDHPGAAQPLGVKEDSIRKCIQRGSLRQAKTQEGRVVLVGGRGPGHPAQDTAEDTYDDASRDALLARQGRDDRRALGAAGAGELPSARSAASPAEWAEVDAAEREEAGMSTRSDEQRQSWWRRMFGG